MSDVGFVGRGDLLAKRLDISGAQFAELGNATKFEIHTPAEIKKRQSKMKATAGQTLDSVAMPQDTTGAFSLDNVNRDNLAMLFLGQDADFSQSSAADAEETLTAKHDQWLDLNAVKVSDVDVAVGSVSYAEDTDFVVKAEAGMIKVLSSGGIADGASITVTYDKGAASGFEVEGNTQRTVIAYLKLDGENLVNGEDCIVDVYKATITPSGALDFLADDFTAADFEFTLETPSGKDHPFKVTSGDFSTA